MSRNSTSPGRPPTEIDPSSAALETLATDLEQRQSADILRFTAAG